MQPVKKVGQMTLLGSSAEVLLDVFFDGLPPSPNRTRGEHWSRTYKEGERWKLMAWAYARKGYKGKPLEQAHLYYHISVGDARAHDADNLIASLKHLQDGLKGTIIEDDDIDHIQVTYTFDREKPRGIRLVVTSSLS